MDAYPGTIDAAHHALFLDVDGTLVEIDPHPDQVVADVSLRERLAGLAERMDGAVALVSGRTIAALDRIFAPLGLSAAGGHGAEVRVANGAIEPATQLKLPAAVQAALGEFAARHEGLLFEPKPGGATLHYRRAPDLENECRALLQHLLAGLGPDYRLIDGKMVLELIPVAASKGEAVRILMQRAPFAGRRPVFVGDDVTDEDGFRAVNALGGLSIRVGTLDGSDARHALPDIAAVLRWLDAIAAPPQRGSIHAQP
jgi:trehalose 6-phosphate phosphatase